jgi:transposase
MKHDTKVVNNVWQLNEQGFSSRQIGYILEIGKSTVNDILSREIPTETDFETEVETSTKKSKLRKPKIAVVDTETSAAVVYTFGRFDVTISQNAVAEEGGKILCACWKWLHKTEVEGAYMQPHEIRKGNDKRVLKALRKVYLKADAVVMHNGRKFDDKVIMTRSIANGLGPNPNVKVIDTLVMAKSKLRLPSNSLDSIGAYFGLGRKIDTGGIDLWVRVQKGCPVAMQEMFTYCKQDVLLLESVFLLLQALGIPGYNAAHYFDDDKVRCRVCGSEEIEYTGRSTFTTVGEFKEVQCKHCSSYSRERTTVNSKAKRKSLLA